MSKSHSLFQFKLKGPWRFSGDLIDGEFELNINETNIKILFPTQTLNVFRMPRLGIPNSIAEFIREDESSIRNLDEPGEPLYFQTDPPLIHHFELYEFFVLVEKVFQNDEIAFEWAKEFLPGLEKQLSDWIETSTLQIASYHARAYQNPEFGGNVKFWKLSNGEISTPITHLYATIVRNLSDEIWGNPVDRDHFQGILRHIESGVTPTIWQLLLRDARTDFAMLNFRKAVLQAGLAAENFLLEVTAANIPKEIHFEAGLHARTFGSLRSFAVKNKIMNDELFDESFIKIRNDAAHRVAAITEAQASEFLNAVNELINPSHW